MAKTAAKKTTKSTKSTAKPRVSGKKAAQTKARTQKTQTQKTQARTQSKTRAGTAPGGRARTSGTATSRKPLAKKASSETTHRAPAKTRARSSAKAVGTTLATPSAKPEAKKASAGTLAGTAAKAAPKAAGRKAKAPSSPFSPGDFVVYPTHGVGRVVGLEEQEIAGETLGLIVISFEKDRMTLRVPLDKSKESGLRKLSSKDRMASALTRLKGRARVKRTMWSRRAQEYEAKINSGDPVSIAEVVRDLFRKEDQPEQSYSERQIYQAALDRLARELAAIERIETDAASEKLENVLRKAA